MSTDIYSDARIATSATEGKYRILPVAALAALLLSGCAGMVPTPATGSSRVHLAASEEFPRQAYVSEIQVGSLRDLSKIATDTLTHELTKRGLVIGEQGKDAEFAGKVTWSQHEILGIDAQLAISLVEPKSRATIWSAEVSKGRDLHTSFVGTIEALVRYASVLLERDIAAHKQRRRPRR